MARPATFTRPVQVRFTADAVKRVTAVAASEGWTWTPSPSVDPLPSVSDAVRRLVTEALDTRDAPATGEQGHTVTIAPAGLDWIDREADRTGQTRDDVVRALLREAVAAREAKRP